ncbi:MAG: aminotransferase class IV [Planctomycetes bacterium]|nr:aminotransferase class IV [Planctomycetota bacterium]
MSEYGYTISIDGKFVSEPDAKVSVLDHGFLFGDSIYEVVRTVDGKLFAADRHLARLHGSAEKLNMQLQRDDQWLLQHWRDMHAKRGGVESYLRIIITRGVGPLSLDFTDCEKQTVIGIAKPLNKWPDHDYAHGCKIVLAQVRRNPKQSTDPAVKSGNYLNNVLALQEARAQGATEAVMMNVQGHVTEATTSNVFMIKDGVVKTPALKEGLLEGVTRGFILQVCQKLEIPCEEAVFTGDELLGADEVFITGTTRDVMPVGFIGDHKIKLTPGSLTIKIANAYHEMLHDPNNHQ